MLRYLFAKTASKHFLTPVVIGIYRTPFDVFGFKTTLTKKGINCGQKIVKSAEKCPIQGDHEVMVAIIDYDAGNMKSVEKAVQALGGKVAVTRDREEMLQADKVILPGVGAFSVFCRRRFILNPADNRFQH